MMLAAASSRDALHVRAGVHIEPEAGAWLPVRAFASCLQTRRIARPVRDPGGQSDTWSEGWTSCA